MKILNHDWNRTASCYAAIAFYAACGLLLLLWPDLAMSIANYALAVILLGAGILLIIAYARGTIWEAVAGVRLTVGLALAFMGVLLLFNPNFLLSLLPFLWGLSLLVGGFGKVQMSVDLKRIGETRWWLALIGAGVSLVLGSFAVFRPVFVAEVIVQFIGVSLLVESVVDLTTVLTTNKKIRDYRRARENQTIEI